MRIAIVFILISIFTNNCFSQNADINLLKNINVDRNKSLDPTFRFISNSVTPVTIGVPVVVYSIGLIQKDSLIKHKGIYIVESVAVSAIISTALKLSVKRERPFNTYSFIEKETSGGSYSFPSGHTSQAFSTAASLSIAFPKWYVIAPSFLWAGAVGYSRMDLGVHYPSDVLAGAIVGAGSAFLSYEVNNWLHSKKKK